jgi:hypothetical protein
VWHVDRDGAVPDVIAAMRDHGRARRPHDLLTRVLRRDELQPDWCGVDDRMLGPRLELHTRNAHQLHGDLRRGEWLRNVLRHLFVPHLRLLLHRDPNAHPLRTDLRERDDVQHHGLPRHHDV